MGSERRAYTRHEVRWDAEVHAEGGARLAMEVRDFCEGGVFLVAASRTAAASLSQACGPDATVTLQMRDPFSGRNLRVRARVAHVSTTALGLSFYQPAPAMITGLMAVNAGQVAASDEGEATAAPALNERQRAHYREVLRGCRTLIDDFLRRGLDTFLAQAEERLLAASDGAATPAEQTALFNARKRVQSRAREVSDAVHGEVTAGWAALGTFALPGQGGEPGTLALVDEADFEDWLARSELITRAESRSQGRLRFLQRRLSHATGVTVDEQRNPVSPAALCHFLAQQMDALRLAMPARKVVYQAFGRTLLQQSGVLYDGLNKRLRDHGLLPDLENERHRIINVRSHPPAALDSGVTAEAGLREGDGDGAAAGGGSRGVMASVRSLFRRQRGEAAPAGGEAPASAPPREALLRAAEAIQPPEPSGAGLREQVDARLEAAGAPALDHATAESVDLLEAWIGGVQRSNSHDDQLREWVNTLVPAALRLELADGSFLAGRDHGLHRLIDHLDRAADVVASLDGEQRAGVTAAVEEILASVNEQADEPDALVDACTALVKLTENPRRRVSANVERLRERYEGSERLEDARAHVQDALAERLGERPVPEPLQALLDGGWQHHLLLTYLREGTDNTTWQRGLQAVELLFRALGGSDGKRHGVKQPQRLLEYLEHHLDRLGRGSQETRALRDDLAYWLTGEGRDRMPGQTAPAGASRTAEQPDLPQEWLGQAKLLEPGAWVVFRDEQGLPKPRRLAWTDRRRSRFVFVDEGGRKAEELDLEGLARAFGEGRAASGSNLDLPATERRWQEMLEGLNRQLVHQATHDPLTGVLNRRTFERRIRHILERRQGGRPVTASVCQFSLDGFKLVNNTIGHHGGDQLLRQLAARLQESVEGRGVVARLGGDEFAVLLPGLDAEAGRTYAEEQRRGIRDWRPDVDGHTPSLGVSVGVLNFSAESHTLGDVLREVDNACTAAREQGGNRCHVTHADDAEAAELREDVAQVARVDQALESRRLRLACQRIAPLAPGRRPLFEVLISVAGEGASAIRPQEFIPAAERFGRMPAVDRWVIRETFAWCAANPGRLAEVDALTINLSAQTLADVDFPQWLRETLAEHNVEGAKICFELTETAATANLGLTADLLLALREMGCRFALDDFGGGLSSYADLRGLPAELLKIDGALTREMDHNTTDRNVVQSVHDLAHHLGKRTVAEFVETVEVFEQARAIGLDYAQGYYIEHPGPLDELGLQRLDLPM